MWRSLQCQQWFFRKHTNVVSLRCLHQASKLVSHPTKMSVQFETSDSPGALQEALKNFWKHEINMTHIESRPCPLSKNYKFFVDFQADPDGKEVSGLVSELKKNCRDVHLTGSKHVPWFPLTMYECDKLSACLLSSDDGDLDADHPGFKDKDYRSRRKEIAQFAHNYKYGQPIPHVKYNSSETACWGEIWRKIRPLHAKYACDEYNECVEDVMKSCGASETNIPQLDDISQFMKERTGFRLRPVAGLLSAREFLYGLAFRTFFCTQYIRHQSLPLYTPEPDIVHEIVGHAPMFAVPSFADFSHQIGLMSIGATDEQVDQLARCYWYSVEFGVVSQHGEHRAYGAGLLSSFGELDYMATSGEPKFTDWDPINASKEPYPITKYQPVYYVADNFDDAKAKLLDFFQSQQREFYVKYDWKTESLVPTRNVVPEKE
eukprot:243245_1